MTDLAEFLLARIADDESRARILAETRRNVWGAEVWDGPESPYPDTPPRILDDCKAKRQIVELHAEDIEHYCPTVDGSEYFNRLNGWAEAADNPQICPTLRLLALPYADHPDYLEEWRP